MPLDIGIGIILGLLLSPFDSNVAANVITGIIFCLLPDLDAIIYYGSKLFRIGSIDKKFSDHRDLLHYPLILIFFGVIVLSIINPNLILIFVSGSFVHFIHDSIGTGWGIPWLYPLSQTRYKFFYQYDLKREGQTQKLMWRWSKSEQETLIDKYGDDEWHKHTFQFWKYATAWQVFELIVFAISISILIIYLQNT